MRQDYVREEKAVIDAEWEHITDSWITRWMARPGKANGGAMDAATFKEAAALDRAESRGLALSGGGIRSAAFAIGALQALNKSYALSRIHYLSTVSGGGYAGSALTWFFRAKSNSNAAYDTARNFPLSAAIEGKDGATLTDVLRFKASYLEPGRGMSTLALAAVVLRSVVMSLLAYFLLLTTLLYAIVPWYVDWPQTICPWLGGSLALLVAALRVHSSLSCTCSATSMAPCNSVRSRDGNSQRGSCRCSTGPASYHLGLPCCRGLAALLLICFRQKGCLAILASLVPCWAPSLLSQGRFPATC